MDDLVIIDYGAGNIRSLSYALQRMGADPVLSSDPERIKAAKKLIFPGVGAAASAMAALKSRGLHGLIPQLKQPLLGICLGMQILCQHSEEGHTPGLGVFEEQVIRFTGVPKVPHMGWNQIKGLSSPLFAGLEEGSYQYFVHSYFVGKGPDTLATCRYGSDFSAALHKDNFYAVQFHPEKSGEAGARILKNFLDL